MMPKARRSHSYINTSDRMVRSAVRVSPTPSGFLFAGLYILFEMPIDLDNNVSLTRRGLGKLMVRKRPGGCASGHEAVEQFFFPEAPVEAVADFREVPLEVLLGDPAVRPPDDGFGVGDNAMDPRQELPRRPGIAQDDLAVRQVLGLGRFPIGSPPVAADGLQQLAPLLRGRPPPQPLHQS